MPLDHFHNESQYAPHTNATFPQGYYVDASYYRPGGPVIVQTLGEDSPEYWYGPNLIWTLANATGGLAVLWPQRYYNGSSIVPNGVYTSENMRFHSTQQALADLAYFAERVHFPELKSANLTAPGTPWILVGGSYGGVISAFSRIQYPDLFYGAIQSSGVTVPVVDFWQYFDAARKYSPQECVSAQQKMVLIGDNIFTSGNDSAIAQYKIALGAYNDTSIHDVAFFATVGIGGFEGNLWTPKTPPFAGPGTYCANITSSKDLSNSSAAFKQVARNILRDAGVANETESLLNPLLNYLHTVQQTIALECRDGTCQSNYQPYPYPYLACKENPQFNTGYIPGSPGRPKELPVISRLLTTASYWQICQKTFNLTGAPDTSYYQQFGGLKMAYPRLVITTGQKDGYRGVTPLAETTENDEPNPRLQNGTVSPPGSFQYVIANGGHEWDLRDISPQQYTAKYPPPAVQTVHRMEIDSVQSWLAEWHKEHA